MEGTLDQVDMAYDIHHTVHSMVSHIHHRSTHNSGMGMDHMDRKAHKDRMGRCLLDMGQGGHKAWDRLVYCLECRLVVQFYSPESDLKWRLGVQFYSPEADLKCRLGVQFCSPEADLKWRLGVQFYSPEADLKWRLEVQLCSPEAGLFAE